MIKKKCIVITRPKIEFERMASLLKKKGFESFCEPAIDVETIHSAKFALIKSIEAADAVIITSNNTLRVLKQFGCIQDVRIISIGKDISSGIEKHGFISIDFAGENVDDLCEYIKQNYCGKNLVYASGENITKQINISNCGANIVRIVVYKTIAKVGLSVAFKRKLVNGDFYGIAFFSSRNAEIFFELLKKENLENHIKLLFAFCLSNKITKHIKKYGFKATIYPENANLDAFCKILSNFDLHK